MRHILNLGAGVQSSTLALMAAAMRGDTYLHAARIPLELVDLDSPEDAGQLSFADECEGGCGL